jgi:RsiW-degrading membrane proteinase PrsW (M82 family)
MLNYYAVYFAATLPAIVIAIYVYKKDQFPEDKSEVVIAFLLGTSITFFLFFLIPVTEAINDIFFDGYGNIFFLQYFRAATLEESLKFLVLYYYAYKLKNFDEPMDAIVFATTISLGFAAVENIEYVAMADNQQAAFDIAFARAFSAIPLHALCGVIMGLFFNYLINFFNNDLKYEQNFKSAYLIGTVLLGLISYLLIAVMIKAFKISDIKLKY